MSCVSLKNTIGALKISSLLIILSSRTIFFSVVLRSPSSATSYKISSRVACSPTLLSHETIWARNPSLKPKFLSLQYCILAPSRQALGLCKLYPERRKYGSNFTHENHGVKQARKFIYIGFSPIYKFAADKAIPANLFLKLLFIALAKLP